MLNFYYLPDYVAAFRFEFTCTYETISQCLVTLSCEILKLIEENQNVDYATLNSPLLTDTNFFLGVDIVLINGSMGVVGAMVVVVFSSKLSLPDLEKHTCKN